MLKVAFYSFGSCTIGMGHIVRSLNLAKEMRTRWPEVRFDYQVNVDCSAYNVLRGNVLPNTDVVNPLNNSVIPDGKWDIIIVDRLNVNEIVMQKLKQMCSVLVSIDDSGPGCFEAHHAFHILYKKQINVSHGGDTLHYYGYRYAILNESLFGVKYNINNRLRRILLMQGGADVHGYIHRIIKLLSDWLKVNPDVELLISLGLSYGHYDDLNRVLRQVDSNQYKVKCNVASILDLYTECDIAISSAGVSALELAAVGVPTVIITGEAKELETAEELDAIGCAVSLGSLRSKKSIDLCATLERCKNYLLRNKMSKRGSNAVDCLGAARIVDIIEQDI